MVIPNVIASVIQSPGVAETAKKVGININKTEGSIRLGTKMGKKQSTHSSDKCQSNN
ncbi:hypothetical protein GCM10027342_07440 [Photobacterium alginatilyticum]